MGRISHAWIPWLESGTCKYMYLSHSCNVEFGIIKQFIRTCPRCHGGYRPKKCEWGQWWECCLLGRLYWHHQKMPLTWAFWRRANCSHATVNSCYKTLHVPDFARARAYVWVCVFHSPECMCPCICVSVHIGEGCPSVTLSGFWTLAKEVLHYQQKTPGDYPQIQGNFSSKRLVVASTHSRALAFSGCIWFSLGKISFDITVSIIQNKEVEGVFHTLTHHIFFDLL